MTDPLGVPIGGIAVHFLVRTLVRTLVSHAAACHPARWTDGGIPWTVHVVPTFRNPPRATRAGPVVPALGHALPSHAPLR